MLKELNELICALEEVLLHQVLVNVSCYYPLVIFKFDNMHLFFSIDYQPEQLSFL